MTPKSDTDVLDRELRDLTQEKEQVNKKEELVYICLFLTPNVLILIIT